MENKKVKISAIISLIAIVVLVAGATYAYFQAQAGEGKQTDITIKSTTADLLTFEVGDPLTFEISMENFSKGAGNLSGETFAQANLLANNKTNVASDKYNVYLLINSNQFRYSLSDKRAELLLQVTDPTGNQLTSIDGLTYTTVTDAEGNSQSGFNVTVYKGLLQLASDYEIKSTSSAEVVTQKWIVKIIFVNYDADQTNNTNKALHSKLYIQQETMDSPALEELCSTGQSFSDCIINKSEYETTLFHHNGTIKDSDGNVIDAADDSYRYSGASSDVKNYVCLGSDATDCPEDNLYRIIGVFGANNHGIKDQQLVKVIKNTSYGNIAWHTSQNNDWSNASLNQTLNTTFKTEKLSGLEDKIAEVTWKVSGYNSNKVTAKTFFVTEITNTTKKYTGKIGLMYASDYGFATIQDYWTTNLNMFYSAARNKDWLYLGVNEWTLSPRSDSSTTTWYIYSSGEIYLDTSPQAYNLVTYKYAVRPAFYLSSSVNFASGDGSSTSPYRIN